MKQAAFLQARMQSRRLPGKTLTPVDGKPLLAYVLDHLSSCKNLSRVVVATSVEVADDPVAQFCKSRGVDCFRGSQEDVAARLLAAAKQYKAEVLVRLCADSPYYDAKVIDRVVGAWEDTSDVVTNLFPRSFPKGQSIEVIRTETLEREYPKMTDPTDLENPFLYFYRQPEKFKILNIASGADYSRFSQCVDTPEDLERFRVFVAQAGGSLGRYGWRETMQALEGTCNSR